MLFPHKIKNWLTAAGILLSHCIAFAQVHSDRRIELVGEDPGSRQVLGLPVDQDVNTALSAGVEQSGDHRFAVALLQDGWEIELPALIGIPEAGTQMFVKIPEGASGNAQLRVNGTGPYPIVLAPNSALEASDVPDGTVLSLVFDGSHFHVMNGTVHSRRPCPDGMVQVNSQFCIEVDERAPESFFQAAVLCAADGRRLCTWAEFHRSCVQQVSLGLQNMVGNSEWADTAANEELNALVVGRISCTSGGATSTTIYDNSFRCCYTR